MSLDQTFLKIFDEEGISEKESRTKDSSMSFSLRVDMKPSSESIDAEDSPKTLGKRDIFSFEEETRLRFPESSETEEAGGFLYYGDSEETDNDPDVFTVIPEPSVRFRQKYAEKKKSGNLPPFLLKKDSAESELPVISLFGDGHSPTNSVKEPIEDQAILKMDEKAEETDLSELAPESVPEPAPSFFKAPGAETLLDSALPCSLTDESRSFKKLHEKGAREFSLLADAVAESMFRGNKILGFGGWGHETGVSTLLLGIVDEMASRGFSVLVIDADFQHPGLGTLLGLNVTNGWENLLRYPDATSQSGLLRVERNGTNHAENHFLAERSRGDSFHLLPLAPERVTDAVAASCKKVWFRTLLELAELFDLVLIDHGSMRTDNDRKKVSELLRFGCDGYYLVTDRRAASEWKDSELTTLSEERRLPCLGIIENFT